MKAEMRQKLAREPFAEKIRKVAQLIRLAKTFPRRQMKRSGFRRKLPSEKFKKFAALSRGAATEKQ